MKRPLNITLISLASMLAANLGSAALLTSFTDDFNRASLGANYTVIGGAAYGISGSTVLTNGGAGQNNTFLNVGTLPTDADYSNSMKFTASLDIFVPAGGQAAVVTAGLMVNAQGSTSATNRTIRFRGNSAADCYIQLLGFGISGTLNSANIGVLSNSTWYTLGVSSSAPGVYDYTFRRQDAATNLISGAFTTTTTNIFTGGSIGFYTENAAAGAYQFDNFSVTVGSALLTSFSDDFNRAALGTNYTLVGGAAYGISNSTVLTNGGGGQNVTVLNAGKLPKAADYANAKYFTASMDFFVPASGQAALITGGLAVNVQDSANFWTLRFRGNSASDGRIQLNGRVAGVDTYMGQSGNMILSNSTWHTLKVTSTAAGKYQYSVSQQGSSSNIVSGTLTPTTVFTGGTIGFYSDNAVTGTYQYDNFSVIVGSSLLSSFSDDFNRAELGTNYTALRGAAYGISNSMVLTNVAGQNQSYLKKTGAGGVLGTLPTAADYSNGYTFNASLDIYIPASGQAAIVTAGLVLNEQDLTGGTTNNLIRFRGYAANSCVIQLQPQNGGGGGDGVNMGTLSNSTWYTLKVSSAAAGVYNYTFGQQGFLSNITSGAFTQTTTNIRTGGAIGLYMENAAAGVYQFDNFSVLVGQSTGAVQVTSTEVWDGTNNPHAADGVILTGLGTAASPAVYTIPKGMNITGTGKILLNTTTETSGNSIRFNISGGDLTMAAGAVINTSRHNRNGGNPSFILDLAGTNNIVGAGSIVGLTVSTDSPRHLTITNVNNVSLASIDGHSENVNSGSRTLLIQANGAVAISGTVDNGDRDTTGGDTGDVTINAASITVSNIITAPWRTTGVPNAGKVILKALSPAGGYSTSAAANNTYSNKLIINGAITTKGSAVTLSGNITNQAVVVKLSPAFTNVQPAAAALVIKAGTVPAAADLFINQTVVAYAAVHDVLWSTNGTASAISATALASSLNPSATGSNVTFTATVTAPGGTPTNYVQFRTNGVAAAAVYLNGSGVAAYSTTLLRHTNTVTAQYMSDGNYLGSTGSVVQVVSNTAPVASGDSLSWGKGAANKYVSIPNLLANDTDADGDTLALIGVDAASGNGVLLTTNGSYIEYNTALTGNDSFHYTISDGFGGTAIGTVSITATNSYGQSGEIAATPTNATATFYGIPDTNYYVMRATNVLFTLGISNFPSGPAATNGIIQVVDDFADLPSVPASAFYRLIAP
ncbi:MAG: cadherin-like domain-containing protein [Verrucomicrobia bacterium]|nr:cadherin-like domain-containing protein [Verrucomicrobiota bacterium]